MWKHSERATAEITRSPAVAFAGLGALAMFAITAYAWVDYLAGK